MPSAISNSSERPLQPLQSGAMRWFPEVDVLTCAPTSKPALQLNVAQDVRVLPDFFSQCSFHELCVQVLPPVPLRFLTFMPHPLRLDPVLTIVPSLVPTPAS